MSNHCSKNAVKLYRSHLHLAQIVLYSDRYYRNLSWRRPAVIGQMLMPVENEKIKPAAFTLCHQRMCCRFPLYTSPLLHPASSSSSSKVPTQNTDSILGQKPCVAKKKIEMSRYPFNHSLFFLDSSLFVSDLHTYCTHMLHLFFHIYICHVYFLSANVCYSTRAVELTTTPKLTGAVYS